MFKKAKLYLLLSIVVASTIVSLFGFSHQVAAQTVDPGCENKDGTIVTPVGSKSDSSGGYYSNVCYVGNNYSYTGSSAIYSEDENFKNSTCGNSPLVYLHFADGGGAHVICFSSTGNEAHFIYFPNAANIRVADGKVYGSFGAGKDDKTVTIEGDPVDITDAEKQYTEDKKAIDEKKDIENTAPKSTCQISGIGWLVCPVLSFLGGLADGVYYILDTVFLRLPPVNMDLNDKANGMYISWKIMRDVANIVFVIAFLLIVFSQITSIGISNYGLKKLVPKLIMAAILVNISFFICAAAVDVSNILGTSLKSLLDGASKDILQPETATALNSGGFWQGIITGVLVISFVGTAALAGFATLSLAIGALLFVVPIVVTVLITMIVRQALVVLLIVVSPLAFVALLLPNTESYYKKWLELFKAMLLMYPIIALMFGASSLASTVLMAAAKDAGDLQVLHQIAGGAVRVLPLVFIPALMKISSGIFGRITGVMNDRQKGWFDAKRNANAERGKIQKANRIAGIGRWARENPSLRRRGLAAMTAYGSSNRELRRKDQLSKAASDTETAYLGERKNQDARNDAKNAQINLQNAQLRADTIRINGTEARNLQTEATELEKRKKTAEDNSQAAALSSLARDVISGQNVLAEAKNAEVRLHTAGSQAEAVATQNASHALETQAMNADLTKQRVENEAKTHAQEHASQELKIQAETSSQDLTSAQNRDKQTYAEVAAQGGGPGTVADSLGISDSVANAARSSSFDSKAVNNALGEARFEGEVAYAKEMQRTGSPLPTAAGGRIHPVEGAKSAIKAAKATENRAFMERVKSHEDTMTEDDGGVLRTTMRSTSLPLEQRVAAAGKLSTNGGNSDIIAAWDELQAMRDAAETHFVATGDETDRKNVQAMMQQFTAQVGKAGKLPSSIVEGEDLGRMGRGEQTPTLSQAILKKYHKGGFNGEVFASIPPKQLEKVINTFTDEISRNPAFATTAEFADLKALAAAYQVEAPKNNKTLTQEQTKLFNRLTSL